MMWFQSADATPGSNDSSLVLHLQQEQAGLLLTGDLEAAGVGELLAAGIPGPVSLLKLPHHGSRYSGSERLLDQCSPQYCLVSAGYQNRYALPARQLLEKVAERDIPLYRTDQHGTLRAELREGQWRISRWRDGLFR